jgi:hypothetical protein
MLVIIILIAASALFPAHHRLLLLAAGNAFHRSAYPEAGDYILNIDLYGRPQHIRQKSGQLRCNEAHGHYALQRPGRRASFTVPEGSRVIYVAFSSVRRR